MNTLRKHAFLIIAHQQPLVLETLLQRLDDKRNAVFLHIDRKSTRLYEQFRDYRLQHADLHVIGNRFAVHWGDISQVSVEFLLMEEATLWGPFAYYHLLSGCDLPLKSMDELHRFFEKNQGKEFVGFWNDESHQRDLLRKIRYYYFFTSVLHQKHSWRHRLLMPIRNILLVLQKILGIRRSLGSMEWKKGSNWVSLTHQATSYLVCHKEEILRRMNHTLCPDEIFVQTWLWNSPFRKDFYDTEDMRRGSMRLIDWQRGTPYIWTEKDREELDTTPFLLARKFDDTYIYNPKRTQP